jgi:hypothetical protein
MQIIGDEEVIQTVTVQIRDVETGNLLINGINLVAAETEDVGGRGRGHGKLGKKCSHSGRCGKAFCEAFHVRATCQRRGKLARLFGT